MKLFTRKEIIEYWLKQDDDFLNALCCPSCRDILFVNYGGGYFCENMLCGINKVEKDET